jgi:uncharacterized protein YbjT (DUF2867 family)
MKILVAGGTGKVGTEVVQALLRRGESVRVLTRNKEDAHPPIPVPPCLFFGPCVGPSRLHRSRIE